MHKLILVVSLAAALTAADRKIAVISHRGEHLHHPENTLAAFQGAIDAGADYFELDVRTTADGKLVLMHDSRVDRTTNGTGEVSKMTFAEIRALQVKGGGQVPTFEEALALAEGKIGVYVDSKQVTPREVVDGLERHHLMERSVIYGGWEFLKQVRALAPQARIMPEAGNAENLKKMMEEGAPPVVAFDAHDFTEANVALAKSAGALVYVDRLGPLDKPEIWEIAIGRGADGIQTDHPAELVDFLKKRSGK